jgi:hypothetical protein
VLVVEVGLQIPLVLHHKIFVALRHQALFRFAVVGKILPNYLGVLSIMGAEVEVVAEEMLATPGQPLQHHQVWLLHQ